MKKKLVSLALCFALCLGVVSVTALNATAEDIAYFSDEEWKAMAATNRERLNNGLSPLTTTAKLQNACEVRADELVELFDHTRPDGTTCYTALDEEEISYSTFGENIAAGYSSGDSVVDGWMNSEGHRANILNTDYVHMGIGYLYAEDSSYWNYWVQMFYSGQNCSYSQMRISKMSTDTYTVGSSIEDLYLCAELYCDSCECWCAMPVLSEYCSGYNAKSAGSQTVTVSCLGLTATIRLRLGGGKVSPEVTQSDDGSVYRVYNPYTGEHLLSTAAAEVNSLTGAGWDLDGVAWYAPTSGTPVYRLYNPYDDFHFYTVSEEEIEDLTPLGWIVDGVVSCGAGSDGTPVYRLFNPYAKTCYHLYTTSQEEIDMLTPLGWIQEGVAWYATE